MKAHVRLQGGRLVIEVEGATQKALFEQIAKAQEVFEADQKCGICDSEMPPILRVRHRKSFTFYEMKCVQCRAVLEFGQIKPGAAGAEGDLWPKRVDDQGRPLDFRGWQKHVPPGTNQKGK